MPAALDVLPRAWYTLARWQPKSWFRRWQPVP